MFCAGAQRCYNARIGINFMDVLRQSVAKAILFGSCLVGVSLAGQAQTGARVERVRVLKSAPNVIEIEIQSSQAIAPSTREVSDPTRLVLDFPHAAPGPELRAVGVNRGEVKGVRVGLFSSAPPTTRVVLDLSAPINYQIFPSGKTVIVKLGESVAPAAPGPGSATPEATAPPEPPKPKVTVAFQQGMLTIHSDRASLSEVLNEIHQQTGAEIDLPPGAGQEPVFLDIGPASPRDALNALLDGSSYNFVLVGSSSNPNALERILLSSKDGSTGVEVGGTPVGQGVTPQQIPPQTYAGRVPRTANRQDVTDTPNDQPPPDEPQSADPQVNEQTPPQN